MSIGKIVRWHDDKGFGFVKSDDLDKDVFVHISAFPPNSLRPKVGDDVVFQVGNTPKGLQVTRARYQNQLNDNVSTNAQKGNLYLELERDDNVSQRKDSNVSFTKKTYKQSKLPNNKPKGLFSSLFGLLAIACLIYYGYQNLSNRSEYTNSQVSKQTLPSIEQKSVSNTNFKCDGRQHCSQMNCREEAEWFSQNCPDTKMDGDKDGDVCENDSRW
nr:MULTISPECIES: cold shock domain-containing protein [Moraxella]